MLLNFRIEHEPTSISNACTGYFLAYNNERKFTLSRRILQADCNVEFIDNHYKNGYFRNGERGTVPVSGVSVNHPTISHGTITMMINNGYGTPGNMITTTVPVSIHK